MALEKELADAMAEQSEWKGNPDRLWANVARMISAPAVVAPGSEQTPTPTPARRRPWRVPAWAAAAVIVVAAAGTWGLRPGSVTVPPATPPSTEQPGPTTPPIVKQPGPPPPKGTLPSPNPHEQRGPAPVAAEFEIMPGKEAYAPGEPVHLKLRFWNASKESIQLGASVPELRIDLASAIEDDRQPAMDSVALPELAGRKLLPGEEISVDKIWTGSQVAPGWYRAGLSHIDYQIGGRIPAGIGWGAARFFIAYPPGAVKTGMFESGATAILHDITLTVRKVEFTERETKVSFHLSKLRAPAEFNLELERAGGPTALGGLRYKDGAEGGVEGVAQFDPTPAHTSSITVVVPELSAFDRGQGMEKLTGPWRVTVPLN